MIAILAPSEEGVSILGWPGLSDASRTGSGREDQTRLTLFLLREMCTTDFNHDNLSNQNPNPPAQRERGIERISQLL